MPIRLIGSVLKWAIALAELVEKVKKNRNSYYAIIKSDNYEEDNYVYNYNVFRHLNDDADGAWDC